MIFSDNNSLALVRYVEPKSLDQFLASFEDKPPKVTLERLDFCTQDPVKSDKGYDENKLRSFLSAPQTNNRFGSFKNIRATNNTPIVFSSPAHPAYGVIGRIEQSIKKVMEEINRNMSTNNELFLALGACIGESHGFCDLNHDFLPLGVNQKK